MEALYHAEDKESKEWDYRRLTQHWWDSLLRDVSIVSRTVHLTSHPLHNLSAQMAVTFSCFAMRRPHICLLLIDIGVYCEEHLSSDEATSHAEIP